MKKPNFSWKRVADSFSTRSFRAGGYSVAAAAIVLAIAVMVNGGLIAPRSKGAYEPPHMENGVLVPGRFK